MYKVNRKGIQLTSIAICSIHKFLVDLNTEHGLNLNLLPTEDELHVFQSNFAIEYLTYFTEHDKRRFIDDKLLRIIRLIKFRLMNTVMNTTTLFKLYVLLDGYIFEKLSQIVYDDIELFVNDNEELLLREASPLYYRGYTSYKIGDVTIGQF